MLKQNKNIFFHGQQETTRCLWFLWCEDLTCEWLQHNKHSRHILGVHGNIISTVNFSNWFIFSKLVHIFPAGLKFSNQFNFQFWADCEHVLVIWVKHLGLSTYLEWLASNDIGLGTLHIT